VLFRSGQFVLAAVTPDTDAAGRTLPAAQRSAPGFYVGAATAAIGLIPLIVLPFRPAFSAAELRQTARATPLARAAALRAAEGELRDGADGEAIGRSWVIHGLGVVIGAASSAVLWFGYGQAWYWVAINFVSTVALNELQILTQPVGLIDAWARYRRGALDEPRRAPSSRAAWRPVVTPAGLGIVGTF
jgi:hypothetical protein